MKKLLLLRHGHAPIRNGESDSDRRLSKVGCKESNEVGAFIQNLDFHIDLLKSSDSIRTRQTAANMFNSINYKIESEFSRDIYNASSSELIEIIKRTPDKVTNLLILAHNPGITMALQSLDPANFSFHLIRASNFEVTCKLVLLDAEITHWNEIESKTCKIQNIFFPSNY